MTQPKTPATAAPADDDAEPYTPTPDELRQDLLLAQGRLAGLVAVQMHPGSLDELLAMTSHEVDVLSALLDELGD